jgi:hypothetical protein
VKGHTKKKRSKIAEPIDARTKSNQASALSRLEAERDRKHNGKWLIRAVVVVAIAVAFTMNTSPGWLPQIFPGADVEPASSTSSPAGIGDFVQNKSSEQLLRGRWVRPDGGYAIELGNARPDGRLEASYFNPRPINVSRAEWHRSNDGLHVLVELRQANYPGATYKLRYLPAPRSKRPLRASMCLRLFWGEKLKSDQRVPVDHQVSRS